MKLIDSHAHIYMHQFEKEIGVIIKRSEENDVHKIVMPNIDLKSLPDMHQLVNKFPGICFPALGLHPCSVKENYKEVLSALKKNVTSNKYVAIGECGLDYHWDTTFKTEQHNALIEQVKWANELEIPIILHTRKAFEDTYQIIKKHKSEQLTGVFHCFGESIEDAKRVFDLGFHIGIGGVLTYKNSGLQETIRSLSLEKVILETDSPYLSPVPYRGKRNEPAYIKIIAEKLAEVKSVDIDEIAAVTTANSEALFNI